MAFEKHYDAERPTRLPACVHLRSKAIYVTGDIKNPDHPDEEGSQYCWCNVSQHVLGPDQQDVDRKRCVPGRECFCDTYDV